MKIDPSHRHLMFLMARDADQDGWTKVSAAVAGLVEQIPGDLIEFQPLENGGGNARLTEQGKTVLNYT